MKGGKGAIRNYMRQMINFQIQCENAGPNEH